MDIFAWNVYEAPGVDPSFICHHLNANPSITPKKQPLQRSFREHSDAVKDKVTKLKQAGAIKKVFLSWMAGECYGSKAKKGKMASVHRFHGFKQGSSERSLSYASDRLVGRCYCRPSSDKLFRCLSRIPLNTASIRRPRKDSFCYSHWKLPLQGNVIRLEKCRVHLSKDDN